MSLPEPDPTPQPGPQPQSNAPQEPEAQPWAMSDVSSPPPTPVLVGSEQPKYTPGEWFQFVLGALCGLASAAFLLIIGPAVLTILFFLTKPPRPPLTRGIGLGLAILGILYLGALTLCFFSLTGVPFGVR